MVSMEEIPMSGTDLEKHIGLDRVFLLENLKNRSLANIVKPFIVILYETNAQNSGHWVGLMRYFVGDQEYVEFFDSYGMSPGELYSHNDPEHNKYLNQDKNYLGIMIWKHLQKNPGCKFVYNKIQYQSWDEDIATCGRWVLLRIKALTEKHRTLEEFQARISKLGSGVDKDRLVGKLFQ